MVAIAQAKEPVLMAGAMRKAVRLGGLPGQEDRKAYGSARAMDGLVG